MWRRWDMIIEAAELVILQTQPRGQAGVDDLVPPGARRDQIDARFVVVQDAHPAVSAVPSHGAGSAPGAQEQSHAPAQRPQRRLAQSEGGNDAAVEADRASSAAMIVAGACRRPGAMDDPRGVVHVGLAHRVVGRMRCHLRRQFANQHLIDVFYDRQHRFPRLAPQGRPGEGRQHRPLTLHLIQNLILPSCGGRGDDEAAVRIPASGRRRRSSRRRPGRFPPPAAAAEPAQDVAPFLRRQQRAPPSSAGRDVPDHEAALSLRSERADESHGEQTHDVVEETAQGVFSVGG